MSFIDYYLKKPEYFFQPSTIIKKLFTTQKRIVIRKTPWGSNIEINSKEAIGTAIARTGIYDLAVSEILWRLIEPGDFVLDVGANIGYTANLSSHRAGSTGKVWAFEPNPMLLSRLTKNLQYLKYQNTTLFPLALSNFNGKGFLVLPEIYSINEGVAFIGSSNDVNTVNVELRKLDDLLPDGTFISVLKIDVEGHELSVFKGAQKALDKKLINNIIFEDHNKYPSEVSQLLLEKGYEIFRIEKGWLKVLLKNPNSIVRNSWETINYLATLNSEIIREKLNGSHYKCLLSKFLIH